MNKRILFQIEYCIKAYREILESEKSEEEYLDRLNYLYLSGEIDTKAHTIMQTILESAKETHDKNLNNFTSQIKSLVADNHGQCSEREYSLIVQELLTKPACNFLVFGVGNDSKLWLDVNAGGKTVFLEEQDEWIQTVKSAVGEELDIRKVHYTTDISEWKEIVDNHERLLLQLPEDIINTEWDLIFIDSPMGFRSTGVPGRMQSIYTSSQLNCHRFILHDIDRIVEKTYGDIYLGEEVKHIDKMNIYYK